MRKILTIFIIILAIFLTACTKKTNYNDTYNEVDVVQKCIKLCQETGVALTTSPCLSDELAPDWVCDVVHSPRQEIDNLPENQCSAFIEGKAKHFVEVTPNCELIRKV